jgi:hypothetical protein
LTRCAEDEITKSLVNDGREDKQTLQNSEKSGISSKCICSLSNVSCLTHLASHNFNITDLLLGEIVKGVNTKDRNIEQV